MTKEEHEVMCERHLWVVSLVVVCVAAGAGAVLWLLWWPLGAGYGVCVAVGWMLELRDVRRVRQMERERAAWREETWPGE